MRRVMRIFTWLLKSTLLFKKETLLDEFNGYRVLVTYVPEQLIVKHGNQRLVHFARITRQLWFKPFPKIRALALKMKYFPPRKNFNSWDINGYSNVQPVPEQIVFNKGF